VSDLLILQRTRAATAPGEVVRGPALGARVRDRAVPRPRRRVRPARVDLGGWLLAGYVCLLPVQISLAKDLRLAPSDFFVLAYVVLRGARLRWRAPDWTGWHAAVLIALAGGALYSQLHGTSCRIVVRSTGPI
jgi:hypothetical protein